jgi:hypothetical protein
MATADRRNPLSADEVHALNASAFAADEFEPFVGRIIDSGTLRKVIRDGLVEAGPSCRPAVGMVGYRLTAEGWIRFNRQAQKRSPTANALGQR